jgi:two-component system nitrogen regulation response regulator GlnG
MDRLSAYRWPGNVRELENLVQRLAALYTQEVIGVDVVEAELADTTVGDEAGDGPMDDSISGSVERHLAEYFSAHGQALPPRGLHQRVVREVERPLLQLSLQATGGNQLRAAELLGLNRNTLRKKIRELDIEVVKGLK